MPFSTNRPSATERIFVVLLVALIALGTLPFSPVSAQTDPPKSPPIEPVDPCKPVSSSTSGGDRYIVSAEAVNLRSGPSIDCGIVAELERETELTLVGEFVVDDEFTWVPVETASGAGYVVLQNIQLVPDSATCDRSVKIEGAKENGFTSGSVNLRTGPGLGCAVITTLNAGTPVEVHGNAIQRDGETWLSVSTPLGNGYLVQDGYAPPGSWEQPEAVAVLMYHDIGDNNNRYVVAPWQLEQQPIWLRDNGYTSITPRELAAHLDTGAPLPPRPVILSVDDGWASARIFRDLLTAYGFRGTYMLPSYAELSPEEIYDLNQSGEVCGHSVSHPFLDQLSWEAQWSEVAENKAWLDSITGASTTCFAYPFGAFNEATTQIVIDAGYSLAFHAWDGVQYLDYLDRWHITRIEVSGEWDLGLFASVVSF